MTILSIIEIAIDACNKVIPRPTPAQHALEQARIIAHRGAHDKRLNIIENTMEAFDHARKLGCYGIELDIHATKDGILVVHHDPTLKRLWHKPQAIAELNYQTLHDLVPQIPKLRDVIDRFGKDMHLFVELKCPIQNQQHLADLLSQLTPCKDYNATTF
jgi:glycerophosphoryl diester phosphodiesterase